MPGHVFGQGGENYIRLSLSLSDEQIDILIKKLEIFISLLNFINIRLIY